MSIRAEIFSTFVVLNQNKKIFMRKIILSLIVFVFMSSIVTAQSTDRTFRFGVYGDLGTSWAKPKIDGYNYNGITSAYGYGLLFDYYFTKNYVFNSGLYVDYIGGKLSFDENKTIDGILKSGIMNRKYAIQYLEIPIALKLKTNEIGYLRYFVQLGFNTGFRLKAKGTDEFEYAASVTKPETTSITKQVSFFKLSFVAGLGAEYEINSSISAFGQLNFNNGLSDYLSGSNVQTGIKEKAILNKLGLTVGLIF
jgi:hypothetical protein